MDMTDIRQQISDRLAGYESLDALKAALADWLTSDGSLGTLKQALEAHYADNGIDRDRWGELNERLEFVPLTDEEMLAQSLEAFENYQRTGKGFTQVELERQWATRLGAEF